MFAFIKIVAHTSKKCYVCVLFDQIILMKFLDIEKSVIPWIGKTGRWMGTFIADKFKAYDLNLTIEQWVVLKVLHDKDGLMQNDLAHITSRNKTSLTRLVHTMEKYHLIARLQDTKDKRVNRIFLTKHGSEVFESTFPIMEEVKKELEQGLTKKEIESLIKILQKVQLNIKK